MIIHLSEAAGERIKELMTDAYDVGLRLEVISGGCAGYQYKFSKVALSDERDDDIVVERDTSRLYIDPVSAEKIDGATVDYEKTLMSQQFVVKNPNANITCGCGVSFQ